MAASVTLTGCSDDFLEVTPPTSNPIEEYFTTRDHVYESLISAYAPLQWPDWGYDQYNPLNIMSDIMADDIWPGGASSTDNQYWHLMMNYNANPENCMSGLWTCEYSGIKRCNDVLTYIGWAGDNIDEDERALWTAQMHVLRAYYYCNLWKFWGNIPFYTENLEFPYLAEQLSADDVYNNVITDLEAVIEQNVLPMKWEDTASEDNVGKVSQAMAYMLYAEMVMYQNDESRDVTCFDANAHGTYEHRYQDTGYFLGKYIAKSENNKDQAADGDLNFNNNLRIYRYAETLLNAAELLLRTGGDTGLAETYLNLVHNRSGLTDRVSATIDNIINERHLEFVGEGKRYWDLVRTGKAASTLVPDNYGYRTNTWSESKKYLPIPQAEIDAAQGTLTQNNY